MMSAAAVMLRAVLRYGPVPRSRIARLTGLSPAAVTRQYGALAERGLVSEVDGPVRSNGVGRPHVPVDVDTRRHVVAGIHVAHDFCTIALLDLRGRVLATRRLPHPSDDPARVLTEAANRLTVLQAEELPGQVPLGLGVAAGGWVDPDDGVLVEHASLGWQRVPVRSLLTGVVGLPVMVDSHARALAAAERLFGAAAGRGSVVHLFVGNVVDAAIVTDGVTHRGPRSAAGEVAHLAVGDPAVRCACGGRGCLEATVAEWAWARRAYDAGVIARPSFVDLIDAARAGDATARAWFVERTRIIGRAAALLFDIVNPETLVVTEQGVLHVPECVTALREEVAARSRVCADPAADVVPTSFGPDDLLAVAAGAVQLDAVYTDPLSLRRNTFPIGASHG
ncbi:putative NBD/HSP70 family sugar kinase [Herbihabitans rhizosphaerae]|uniref:Putative NBD/HSP70 family sugar kinase n=2 Tax=Herbihabitans rhizosphaerae TaxID=1872711 RepID=A0A4Q7L2R7_9PSEU|nr:putative NBD/HSP70 family sugar kinase [Herbihabitans rhizosphaerae]